MDPVIDEREVIRRRMRRYAATRYAYGDIHNETVSTRRTRATS